MNKNISHETTRRQITDFFRNAPVSCFCACGKIDLSGVCLPDNSAPSPVIAVLENWTVAIVDVRNGSIIEAVARCASPCIAVSLLHGESAKRRLPVDISRFSDELTAEQWQTLIARESDRLFSAGADAAMILSGNDAEPVRPEVSTPEEWAVAKAAWYAQRKVWQEWLLIRNLPIAQEGWRSAASSLVWDVATFDAHAVEEVA